MGLIRHNLPTIIVLTLLFGGIGCSVLWLFLWQRVGFARASLFAGMLVWTGLLFSITILPKRRFAGAGLPRVCDLDALPSHITGALTNERRLTALLLFVPLTILLVLATRGMERYVLGAVMLALPALIEGVQYLLPGLRRPCSSNDVYDAWIGLLLGLLTGLVLLPVLRRAPIFQPVRARHRDPSSRPNPADVVKVLWPSLDEATARRPDLPPPTFVPSGARRPPGDADQANRRPAANGDTLARHAAERPDPKGQ